MNIHHLELFYYVATHGGISRAARHMPYGIQQPAVSSQILQLEDQLGTRLFVRTPFKLTPAGEELYAGIKSFFENLDGLAERISRKNTPRLRIGAAEMVLADYLPPVLQRLRKEHGDFRLGLQAMGTAEMERLFAEQEIDVAVSPLDRKLSPRLKRELLVSLTLALVVPKRSSWRTADEVLATAAEEPPPLICLPAGESLCACFHEGLRTRQLDWPVAIEASSLALLGRYVENGYGIGVSVATPEGAKSKTLRLLPLDDFPALELFAIWADDSNPLVSALLQEIHQTVREQWGLASG